MWRRRSLISSRRTRGIVCRKGGRDLKNGSRGCEGEIVICAQVLLMLAMLHQKLTILMAPLLQQRRHPAGVLQGVLLLLCLVLLMRASAMSVSARPVPSDDDNGCHSEIATCTQLNEGVTRSQEVSHMEMSALPRDEVDEDDLSDCMSLPESTAESCAEYINRRFLTDYGSPTGNSDPHPGGPIP